MNLQTRLIPRLLTRIKRSAEPKSEGMDGVHLQEQLTSAASSGPAELVEAQSKGATLSVHLSTHADGLSKGPAIKPMILPTEAILSQRTCAACTESAAATTLFIPLIYSGEIIMFYFAFHPP